MMADPAFIAERRERLVGLVITHAHEDHSAARLSVAFVALPGLPTPFAAAVLRRKLADANC